MDELVQFLRARLDEDERIARAVTTPGAWRVGRSHGGSTIEGDGWTVGHADELDAAHIVRHDPARALTQVEVKRQALDHYEAVQDHAQNHEAYALAEGAVRRQIQIMALPYADHPAYKPEWRP